jgi:hypothetical protein
LLTAGADIYSPGNEVTSILTALVALPNAIRPRSPTEYGPWKSHATPLEVVIPMCPMNGRNQVIGGSGDHTIEKERGWSCCCSWWSLIPMMHDASAWQLLLLDAMVVVTYLVYN